MLGRSPPVFHWPRMPWTSRSYAISVKKPKVLPGKSLPRVFKDKKAFQYNWYTRILQSSTTSPLIFLRHNDFTAQRLIKLRRDIAVASNRVTPSLASPPPGAIPATPAPQPLLTVIRTSIFGAALRDFPNINLDQVDKMTSDVTGGLAVLTLPTLDPPQLNGILRALDRGVPPRKPKTEEELAKELADKNADPATPGRRMKRMRPIRQPELSLVGAFIDGQVFLPERVRNVSKLPSLETLRAQVVGLLSSPATQLAGVLSEASGGRLARTLEGLKKGLEGKSESGPDAPGP